MKEVPSLLVDSNFQSILERYQSCCIKIASKLEAEVSHHSFQSMRILHDGFANYEQSKKSLNYCLSTQEYGNQQIASSYADKHYSFSSDPKVYGQNFCSAFNQKSFKKLNHTEDLSNKWKKMKKDIQPTQLIFDSDPGKRQTDNLLEEDTVDFHQQQTEYAKDLKTLIEQSNKKILQAKDECRHKEDMDQDVRVEQRHSEYDSEYDMTDYSSNQSSNNGEYQTHSEEEDSGKKPLFGNLFQVHKIGKTTNADHHGSSANQLQFKAMEFLKSPKKMPLAIKRLYIGSKKIPRWAQNLPQLRVRGQSQKAWQPQHIYGTCLVENLDTNVIFGDNELIKRTSSAKWDRKIFLT